MHGLIKVPHRRRQSRPRYSQLPHHAVERAVASARALHGEPLGVDSVAEAATMFGVSPAYTSAAVTVLSAEAPELLEAVLHGNVSLLAAAKSVRQRVKLLTALREATADDLARAAAVVGVDRVWDRLIAPNV
jgi:hypothetical protein